jgi:hypothetical protein
VTKHIFDISETATREQAARQLRVLADQIADGSIEMSYGDFDAPTPVTEPLHIVIDLTRHRHNYELVMHARWAHGDDH